ncbi:unnamed protein product [Brassicogethes aeneus]|uniref:lysozyme n=1 Tax=Brassicogethes aeneus TaxID=1431903 RepID=A0A9P0F978_BRAAE|nr:unnamed protein product [Brassicogethes aeneus]
MLLDLTIHLLAVALVYGKIYERCELARDLRLRHGIPEHQVATWVCIAQHESLFNTSAHNPGSGDHGLFQISELFWCSPPGNGRGCNKPCSAFANDDIADDVQCIKIIHEEHTKLSGDGFNAWVVYPLYCKGNVHSYIQGCDSVYELPPIPSVNPEIDDYDDGYDFPPLPKYQNKNLNDEYQFPALPKFQKEQTLPAFSNKYREESFYTKKPTTTTLRTTIRYDNVNSYFKDDYDYPALPPFPKHASELNNGEDSSEYEFHPLLLTTLKPKTTTSTTFKPIIIRKFQKPEYENTRHIYTTTILPTKTTIKSTSRYNPNELEYTTKRPYIFQSKFQKFDENNTEKPFYPTNSIRTTENPTRISTKKLISNMLDLTTKRSFDIPSTKLYQNIVFKSSTQNSINLEYTTKRPFVIHSRFQEFYKQNTDKSFYSTSTVKITEAPTKITTKKYLALTTKRPFNILTTNSVFESKIQNIATTRRPTINPKNPYNFSSLFTNFEKTTQKNNILQINNDNIFGTKSPVTTNNKFYTHVNVLKKNPYDFSSLDNILTSSKTTERPFKITRNNPFSFSNKRYFTTSRNPLQYKTTKSPYNFDTLFSKKSSKILPTQNIVPSSSLLTSVVTNSQPRISKKLPSGSIVFNTESKHYSFERMGNGFRLIRKTRGPVLLSFPHFLHADKKYLDTVHGLNPDENKHETFVILEPNSGTPIKTAKRVQFNMFLRPIEGITSIDNVTHSIIPIIWLEESMTLGDKYTNQIKDSLLKVLHYLGIMKWVVLIIGAISIIVPFFFLIYTK